MQPLLTIKSLHMFLRHILEHAFPGESGASRLQQLGLFTLIYVMQEEGHAPVTAKDLAELTGQSDGDVSRRIKKLVALDLIDRNPIPNPRGGRGTAFKLTVKDTPEAKRLIKAIKKPVAKSTAKKTRRKRKT
jgi:DNA-binding MarR family transcriptional regulator